MKGVDESGDPCEDESVLYFMVDSTYVGNESRFINDFHNITDEPNVRFAFYRDPFSQETRAGIFALRTIYEGEEILVDYGEAWWSRDDENDNSFYY